MRERCVHPGEVGRVIVDNGGEAPYVVRPNRNLNSVTLTLTITLTLITDAVRFEGAKRGYVQVQGWRVDVGDMGCQHLSDTYLMHISYPLHRSSASVSPV